jgi:hypothetical protein
LGLWAVFAAICGHHMRQDKTNTESNGDKRGPEYQKGSFLRLKRKKEGESAFSDFIGFYFIYLGLSAFTDFIQV